MIVKEKTPFVHLYGGEPNELESREHCCSKREIKKKKTVNTNVTEDVTKFVYRNPFVGAVKNHWLYNPDT